MVANVFNPNTQEAKIGGWEILRTAWIKSETYKWELPEISCDCSVNFSGIKWYKKVGRLQRPQSNFSWLIFRSLKRHILPSSIPDLMLGPLNYLEYINRHPCFQPMKRLRMLSASQTYSRLCHLLCLATWSFHLCVWNCVHLWLSLFCFYKKFT